jgi:hypothetical protein
LRLRAYNIDIVAVERTRRDVPEYDRTAVDVPPYPIPYRSPTPRDGQVRAL